MKRVTLILLCLFNSLLVGCGGGGGGGTSGVTTGGSNNSPVITTEPGSATVHLLTSGSLLTNETIRGITVTVNLPPGVNIKLKSTAPVPDITGSGVAAGKISDPIIVENVASNSTTGGKITFTMVVTDPAGIGIGEFATIQCSTSPGPQLQTSQFSFSNVLITGGNDFHSLGVDIIVGPMQLS